MRVGLLSDIHANLGALEAVLVALGRVDGLWVTGDSVGYGPDPLETLVLLRERGATMVAGNHDRAVATGEGIEFFNGFAAAAAQRHRDWLPADERAALAELPLVLTLGDFTLCHGSLRDPLWEYVFSAGAARASLDRASTPHCCNGHTHAPALFHLDALGITAARVEPGSSYALDARTMLNPGSVGQPRDGDPRAAYAVIDTDARTVTFERAPYRVEETQRRIRARGLPEVLADRLSFGL